MREEKYKLGQRQIELEFQSFMEALYPNVEKDSRQYKLSRLLFYCGIATLSAFQNRDSVAKGVIEDLGVCNEFAKKGVPAEETLADLVASRGE